jgi:hypothetical protein
MDEIIVSGRVLSAMAGFVNHRHCGIMRMRQIDMSDVVHLLWFAKEMPDGEDDIELLIGVYSSNEEATASIPATRLVLLAGE